MIGLYILGAGGGGEYVRVDALSDSKKKERGKKEEKKRGGYPIIGGFNQLINFGIRSIKL